ncbi:MAG TPA: hypothetical protein VGB16_04575 [candidate division Zixibacteria bacterium]
MKKKGLYFLVLFIYFLLNVCIGRGSIFASSDGGLLIGGFGAYVFTDLDLLDYKAKDYRSAKNSATWDMHLQVAYTIKHITPQLDFRLIDETTDGHPGIFSSAIEYPDQELRRAYIRFAPITTSLRFEQRVMRNLEIHYLPGISYLHLETFLKVYDKIAGKDVVILRSSRDFLGPTLSLEPRFSQPISEGENSKKSLFLSSRYAVTFAKEIFHTIYLKLGMQLDPVSENEVKRPRLHTVYVYFNYDINDTFEGYDVGIGWGGLF